MGEDKMTRDRPVVLFPASLATWTASRVEGSKE